MSPIVLSSCDRCNPKKWKRGKEAVGLYVCAKCRKSVKYVMERRQENEIERES